MSEPKVSERMFNLVTDYGADCINHGINTNRPLVGYPLVTGIDHQAKEAALLSAIAEIEQRAGEIDFFASIVRDHYADIVMPTVEDRSAAKPSDWVNCAILELGNQHKRAEKWKEAAVALQNERLARSDLELWITTPENIRNQPESFCEAVDRADRATRAVAQSIAALGDEWDEAVR